MAVGGEPVGPADDPPPHEMIIKTHPAQKAFRRSPRCHRPLNARCAAMRKIAIKQYGTAHLNAAGIPIISFRPCTAAAMAGTLMISAVVRVLLFPVALRGVGLKLQ